MNLLPPTVYYELYRIYYIGKRFRFIKKQQWHLYSRAEKETNCRTTRIQCDVYAAQNSEVLMVSEGKTFF